LVLGKLSQVVTPLNCVQHTHILNQEWGTKCTACLLKISTAHQDKFWYRTLNRSILSPSFHVQFIIHYYAFIRPFIFSPTGRLTNAIQKCFKTTNFILYAKLYFVTFCWMCKPKCCLLVQKLMSHVVTAERVAALWKIKFRVVLNKISLKCMPCDNFSYDANNLVWVTDSTVEFTSLLTYLLNYLLTYLLT
jgi:hypothetical protein